MTYILPDELKASEWASRTEVAVAAVTSCGAALRALRGAQILATDDGVQLKTNVDLAAEGWVLGLMEASFPGELFLSEERYDNGRGPVLQGARGFWTVDALDGTRSYVDGFDGYCVQVAYIENGVVEVGVIAEPANSTCFVAIRGQGAFALTEGAGARSLKLDPNSAWPAKPRFVDSTLPKGPAGAVFERLGAELLECGSVGLKLCRVAEGRAELYAKEFKLKIWDIAPGEVILSEAGARLVDWAGEPFPYTGKVTHFSNVAAIAASHFGRALPIVPV